VAEHLLCKGWREATLQGGTWYVLHVETPEESLQAISPGDFRALLDNVNLATDLGAKLEWLKSSDVVGAIVEFRPRKKDLENYTKSAPKHFLESVFSSLDRGAAIPQGAGF
jgi:K+-sensing histidine kinase KdpD